MDCCDDDFSQLLNACGDLLFANLSDRFLPSITGILRSMQIKS